MKLAFASRALVGSTALALWALGAGCESDRGNRSELADASVHVSAPTRDALVGDTLTFVAKSTDTYGRDAKIKWSSTAGEVRTDEGGRVARVTFNEPGTYSIRATLELDGQPVSSDIFEVRVAPVK
jgi:hypothetical protein